jgi:endosialidase-like protein
MTTLHSRKSIDRSPSRYGLFLIPLVLAAFALSPTAQAQLNPPPDGGYEGDNTAEGDDALFKLEFGAAFANTAIGFEALRNNTSGSHNTATGFWAMRGGFDNDNITTGEFNTAMGSTAFFNNRTGDDNTAIGYGALSSNRSGNFNTATGSGALGLNTTGNRNTANGFQALFNTTGSDNIALGWKSGFNLTTGNNNIDIGALGASGESNTIRIGTQLIRYNTYIQGISGVAVTGSQVVVAPNGKLGVTTSSARFKQDIEPMDKASQAILALKPVTFRYKREIDSKGIPQFGLVAEDVEKVNPNLVVRDKNGEIYTVRYEAVNAMLLNEFLKEHRKVQELEANAANQQKEIKALTAAVKEQASQIQKVTAQLEVSKPAPQTVMNNQ